MLAGKRKGKRGGSIYMKTIMKRKISIPFNSLGSNLEDILTQQMQHMLLVQFKKEQMVVN